ncbi:HipA domain-containing protein [Occultella kanbiaonis]|uniref:HipA domain-containing protein n=1 Tax=Occultella kanbiaonis TaxID=2675754 RepID=UPI0013D188E2|nr:HipA domain-containing protein [Occultella kanbiaonis]
MADRNLAVHMDGTPAGTMTLTGSGNLTFTYDEDYRRDPAATPLSLSMPKATTRHRQRAVLPFIAGLLPDNEQALGSLAATYQVSATSPFAILEHVGSDVAGALQILPPGQPSTDQGADRSASEPIGDDEVARDLAKVIDAYRTGRPLHGRERLRMSLAGAQPKIALVRAPDGTWRRPGSGAPTTHILKAEYVTPRTAADERYPGLSTVELFSLAVARHTGLPTPDAHIWTSPDAKVRALVLSRYDRQVGPDSLVHRIHQEDLCQALMVPPSKKYQHRDGGPGVGAVARLLRSSLTRSDRTQVARDFLALLTLNIAMVNTDAHAKNYSLMLAGDRVELAPAYDVLSFAPYETFDPSIGPIELPMRIGGTYRVSEMFESTIASEGVRLGLDAEESRTIVDRVIAAVPGALEAARQDVSGMPGSAQLIDTTVSNLRRLSPLHPDPPTTVDLAPHPESRPEGGSIRRKTTPGSTPGP